MPLRLENYTLYSSIHPVNVVRQENYTLYIINYTLN